MPSFKTTSSSAAVLKKSSLSSVSHLGRGTSWGSWPSWSIGLSGSWRTSCPGTTRTCLQRGRQCSGRALNYDKHSVFGEKDSVTNCEPTILRILIGDLEILQLFFGPPPVNRLFTTISPIFLSENWKFEEVRSYETIIQKGGGSKLALGVIINSYIF